MAILKIRRNTLRYCALRIAPYRVALTKDVASVAWPEYKGDVRNGIRTVFFNSISRLTLVSDLSWPGFQRIALVNFHKLWRYSMRIFWYLLAVSLVSVEARGVPLLTEGFDDVTTLTGGGWVQTNNSVVLGTTGWFQGDSSTAFPAQSGAANSYIAANFLNADVGGDISNWLLTPTLNLNNGDQVSFYTRSNGAFADRLEIRLSTNGASSNVGATAASVGDFSNLLLSINPALSAGGYPSASWTLETITLAGLGGPVTGRLGFRYFVTDISINGDYIGIDTLSVNQGVVAVSAPGTLACLGMGLVPLVTRRRGGLKKGWRLASSKP
jgi:hypothetical protein